MGVPVTSWSRDQSMTSHDLDMSSRDERLLQPQIIGNSIDRRVWGSDQDQEYDGLCENEYITT